MKKQRAIAALAVGVIGASAFVAIPAVAAANAAPEPLRINEVESSGGNPGDWIEFFNPGETEFDLSGYVVKDSDDSHVYTFPDATLLAGGGYLMLDEAQTDDVGALEFDFGLGGGDTVRLFNSAAELVDSFAWTSHASVTYGVNDAGEWADTSEATKGTLNVFAADDAPAGLRLNEVDSSPADWVELINTTGSSIALSGFELRDDSDDHSWIFPTDSTIAPGEYLVVDADAVGLVNGAEGTFTSAIGIGSTDKIRLFDSAGALVDDTGMWDGHATHDGDPALATLARCVDGIGDFLLAHPTPGATNSCIESGEGGETPAPLETASWPGSADVRAIDIDPMFLEDSSGLDTQVTEDGTFLWAVDNGTGRFWKLDVQPDGSAVFADGWEDGKRARFQKDAEVPGAAGPDTEGITVADDGLVYLASERDNSAKGVNFNVILQVDPAQPGPDVVSTNEWDLTELLPAVSANLGIEAVEWVSDTDLAGNLIDDTTGAAYEPADYVGHGNGLFFVAVEDGGRVFAFALNADGSATQVAEIHNDLNGVMALDYDSELGGLWAVCDNGCEGASALISFTGAADPDVTYYARPAAIPADANNEGFATAPSSFITGADAATADMQASDADAAATRAVWWFEDGVTTGALRAGALAAVDSGAGGGSAEGSSAAGGSSAASGAATGSGTAAGAGVAEGSGTAAGIGGASGSTSVNGSGSASGQEPATPAASTGPNELADTGWGATEFLLVVVAMLAVMGTSVLIFGRRLEKKQARQ